MKSLENKPWVARVAVAQTVLLLFLTSLVLAQVPGSQRFLERHPGDWRFTYLPDGRIGMLYGAYIEVPDTPAQPRKARDPVALALRFFEAEKEFFAPGLSAEQLKVVRVDSSMAGQHVHLQQVQQGYVVDNAFFEVHLTADGRIFQVNNSLVPVSAKASYEPKISAEDAAALAREFLANPKKARGPTPSSRDLSPPQLQRLLKQIREARAGNPHKREIPLIGSPELVLYAVGPNLKLCWKMVLNQGPDRHMLMRVDAVTGRMLFVTNLIVQFRDGSGSVYSDNPAVTPKLEIKTLPNLDESGFLQGRYTQVYLATGLDSKGVVQGRLDANSASGSFVYVPSDARVSEVNMYYHINRIHDYFKSEYGFTRADVVVPAYVRFIPATGALNNAYYDQQANVMIFGTTDNNLDLSLDGEVVYHEYTHSVVDRIIAIGDNIQHSEARGMNEGFADYFAATLVGDPCMYEFAKDGFGLSNQPCLRDLTNRKRYPEDIEQVFKASSGNLVYLGTEEHIIGEVWVAALWDLRVVLGGKVADKLVFQSLFLIPQTAPRFSQGMAAILSADQQLNGGANASKIREIFSARGISEVDTFPQLISGEGGDGFNYAFGDLDKAGGFTPSPHPGKLFNGRTYFFEGIAEPSSLQAVKVVVADAGGRILNTGSSAFKTTLAGKFVGFSGLVSLSNFQAGGYKLGVGYSSDQTNFKYVVYDIKLDNVGPPTRVFTPLPPPSPSTPQITSITPAQWVQGTKTEAVVRGSGFKGKVAISLSPDTGLKFEGGAIDTESQISVQYTVAADAATGDRTVTVLADNVPSNSAKISIVEKSKPVQDIVQEKDEKEDNGTIATANPIKAGEIFKGTIDPPGDLDVYVYQATAGTTFTAEVFAQRLKTSQSRGSRMDSVVAVFDENLDLITFNDDIDFDGGNYDSAVSYRPEKSGKYYILVLDASLLESEDEGLGGPEFFYKLRVSEGARSGINDTTPPSKPTINAPGRIFGSTTMGASWSSFDVESGIDGYRFAIGTTPEGEQVRPYAFTSNASFYVADLKLTHGGIYYVSVKAINGAGLISETSVSAPIKVDLSTPVKHMIFPRLVSNRKDFTGMALVNDSSEATEVVYTAFNNIGRAISGPRVTNPKTLQLNAHEQKARLESEIFNLTFGSQELTGWVDVTVPSSNTTGFYLFGDYAGNYLDGADVQTTVLNDFILPQIYQKAGSYTEINLVNPASTPATVTLDVFDAGGVKKDTRTIRIAAGGRYFGNVGMIFDLSSYTAAYIRGRSTQGVVPFEVFGDSRSIAGLNGLDTTAAAAQLYVAQLASGSGLFTELTLVNPGSGAVTVEVKAHANGGELIPSAASPSVSRTIPAGGHLRLLAKETFGLPDALVDGYIEATVKSGGAIVGNVTFGTLDGRALASLPIQSTGKRSITLSHVAQGSGYFTGVTMLNTTSTTMTLIVTVYDSAGKLVGTPTPVTLASKQKIAKLISELVPAVQIQAGGHIKIVAPDNIFCFELFGAGDLNFLAAVPAQ